MTDKEQPQEPEAPSEEPSEEAEEPPVAEEEKQDEPEQAEEADSPVVLRVGGLQDVDCWNPFSCTAIYMWGDLLVEGLTIQGKASEGCDAEPDLDNYTA